MVATGKCSGLSYRAQGEGPLLVLLHGLLMSGDSWLENGFVQTLSQHYRVVYPDLLAHGRSEIPSADRYTLKNMADGIAELIGQQDGQQAHILGYSAGAWLATGLLKYHPQRLSSLIIGGWDVIKGLPKGPQGKLNFADFMAFAKNTAPDLASGVTKQQEPGLSAFFSSLADQQQVEKQIAETAVPVLFWAGRGDPYYPAIAAWTDKQGLPLLSSSGDHLSSVQQPDPNLLAEIVLFLQRADHQ